MNVSNSIAHNTIPTVTYDGDSFFKKEMQAFFSTAEPRTKIFLRSNKLNVLRNRILNLSKKEKLVVTTTKINESLLCLTYGGRLHTKKIIAEK